MTTPTPSWYDVLGVSRDATPDEIKAAWRHATDRFEPGSGSGQFRMFNDAADVLLDPDRRREYDATLDTPTEVSEPDPLPETEREDVGEAPPAPLATEEEASAGRPGRGSALGRTLGRISPVVLALLAVLTVAAVVGAVFLGLKAQQQAREATAREEAPAAAERAVKALFSYDYRNLDADRKRAEDYLSPRFAKKYFENFDALEKQKDGSPGLAVQTKAVVTTDVQGSGVVDVDEDGTAARVLVFVNLVSRKAEGDPQIFQNRVAMTMKKDGDHWLVDKVDSY